MDVDGLFTGTWLGRKRPVPWSLSKKNISYIVFDFNITSYFTVNNFVIDVGRRKKNVTNNNIPGMTSSQAPRSY